MQLITSPFKRVQTILFFIILLIFLSNESKAQYLKGGNGAQIGIGFTEVGILGNFYYSRNFGQSVKGLFGTAFNYGKISDIDYYGIYLDAIMSNSIASAGTSRGRNGAFRLNVQTGISFVIDGISDFENNQRDNNTSLNYGVIGGLELEFAMSSQLAIALAGNARYYIKEDFGKWRYQGHVGLRYTLGN